MHSPVVLHVPLLIGQRITRAGHHMGRLEDDAEDEAKKVLQLDPFFEIDNYGTVFRNQEDRAKIIDGLRKAGLN